MAGQASLLCKGVLSQHPHFGFWCFFLYVFWRDKLSSLYLFHSIYISFISLLEQDQLLIPLCFTLSALFHCSFQCQLIINFSLTFVDVALSSRPGQGRSHLWSFHLLGAYTIRAVFTETEHIIKETVDHFTWALLLLSSSIQLCSFEDYDDNVMLYVHQILSWPHQAHHISPRLHWAPVTQFEWHQKIVCLVPPFMALISCVHLRI